MPVHWEKTKRETGLSWTCDCQGFPARGWGLTASCQHMYMRLTVCHLFRVALRRPELAHHFLVAVCHTKEIVILQFVLGCHIWKGNSPACGQFVSIDR